MNYRNFIENIYRVFYLVQKSATRSATKELGEQRLQQRGCISPFIVGKALTGLIPGKMDLDFKGLITHTIQEIENIRW